MAIATLKHGDADTKKNADYMFHVLFCAQIFGRILKGWM